jgi:hypothetical protein
VETLVNVVCTSQLAKYPTKKNSNGFSKEIPSERTNAMDSPKKNPFISAVTHGMEFVMFAILLVFLFYWGAIVGVITILSFIGLAIWDSIVWSLSRLKERTEEAIHLMCIRILFLFCIILDPLWTHCEETLKSLDELRDLVKGILPKLSPGGKGFFIGFFVGVIYGGLLFWAIIGYTSVLLWVSAVLVGLVYGLILKVCISSSE